MNVINWAFIRIHDPHPHNNKQHHIRSCFHPFYLHYVCWSTPIRSSVCLLLFVVSCCSISSVPSCQNDDSRLRWRLIYCYTGMLTNSNLGIQVQVTCFLLLTLIIKHHIWVSSEGRKKTPKKQSKCPPRLGVCHWSCHNVFCGEGGGCRGGMGWGGEVSAWAPCTKTQNKKRAPITSLGCKVQLPC